MTIRADIIVCDYVGKRVRNYLKSHSGGVMLTFFKEPFYQYRDSKVIFIDDILDESDYKEIDECVDRTIHAVDKVLTQFLTINGYNLFEYLKEQAKRNFSRVYKYKHAVDRIVRREKTTNIVYFSCEFDVCKLLMLNYKVKRLPHSIMSQRNLEIKARIKAWLHNSRLMDYVVNRGARDHLEKPNHILWLGGRSVKSERFVHELKKHFTIWLFQNQLSYSRVFRARKIEYGLLRLRNHKRFAAEWRRVKKKYEEGLKEIFVLTGWRPRVVESILGINGNSVRQLLRSLFILEENELDTSLLFVEQSVLGIPRLAVDYFGRGGLLSLEVLHGVPGVVEVGRTSKVGVYGPRDIAFLSKGGVPESKLVITGCPDYDKLCDIEEGEKDFDVLLLILDWISSVPSRLSHGRIFAEVSRMLGLLGKLRNEELVIKLHPGQSEEEVRYVRHLAEIAGLSRRVKVTRDMDIITLLKKAKIVFTYVSSVGLEGLMMRKPVVILGSLDNRKIKYDAYGGCVAAENDEALWGWTEDILRDIEGYLEKKKGNIDRTIEYFYGVRCGESYRRVVDLCREMCVKARDRYDTREKTAKH